MLPSDRADPLPLPPWTFIGGLLSGWVAVCVPSQPDVVATCAAEGDVTVDAMSCQWTTAWCVISCNALTAFERGEAKGWLPLDKAELQVCSRAIAPLTLLILSLTPNKMEP